MHQVKAFENFLRAFYQQPFDIKDYSDLNTLTEMADYYRALRIVSLTLDATFQHSEYFKKLLPDDSLHLLGAAAKLRNGTLFTDCVTISCGSSHTFGSDFDFLSHANNAILERKIRNILHAASHVLARHILYVEQALIDEVILKPEDAEMGPEFVERKRKMGTVLEEQKVQSLKRDSQGHHYFHIVRQVSGRCVGYCFNSHDIFSSNLSILY